MKIPTAIDVSHLFLSWANRDGDFISNLKLQKLLYYAQAWHLANFSRPLFSDSIEAWDFGPVVPNVYHALKKFKANPISYNETKKEEDIFSPSQLNFLKLFYGKFIGMPSFALVNSSHNETPWKEAFLSGKGTVISNESIKNYFHRQIKK